MDNETEFADSSNSEDIDTSVEAAEAPELDAAALQAKLVEVEQKNRQLFERAKKAEGFVLKDGHWVKGEKPAPKSDEAPTPGDLDETQLDYLDLKGINESDDLDIIQSVMKRTGQTVRQALKDEYVVEKLKANQARREVANAMPSGTKRSGAGAMGVDAALARYEATGELPADFETRSAVINLKEAKTSGTAPPWRR